MKLPDGRGDVSAYRVANTRILLLQSRTLLATWKVLKAQSQALLGKSRQILSRR
jgi:hypothetical protein